jgi:cytochrome b561
MHPIGYALIILLPLTGLLLTVLRRIPLELYGWAARLPVVTAPVKSALWSTLHDQILPASFYVFFALHLGAVIKHHFISRRTAVIRRMLR